MSKGRKDKRSKLMGDEIIVELITILKHHDVNSEPIKEFLNRHMGIEYFNEFQSILDVKELLDVGLLR